MTTEKMRLKSFGLFALSIFALVLVAGLASAVTFSDWVLNSNAAPTNVNADLTATNLVAGSGVTGPLTFGPTGVLSSGWDSATFDANDYYEVTLSPKAGSNFSVSSLSFNHITTNAGTIANIIVSWSKNADFSSSTNLTLSDSTSNDVQELVSLTSLNIPVNTGETLRLRIFAYDTEAASDTFSIENLNLQGTITTTTLTETSICAFDNGVTSNPDYLEVDIRDINVVEGFGDDENWLPFDEIEVEIRVENNGINNYDIDDISLEWGIAPDNLNDDWLVDFDEIDEFNLKDDDEDTFTITFKIDEDDLDMDLEDFVGNDFNLVVRATGNIDDEDDLLSVDETCAADSEAVSIDESNVVVLTNINAPDTLQCGQTYTITADAWNIGNNQEDEVRVDVFDRNRELIDELFELGDINEFDNTELSFDLQIPRDAEEGTYSLILRVLDEDSDVYEIGDDDDPAEFFLPLVVSGGCSTASQVTVSANVVSGGREGQELVVRATVTNTGNSLRTYTLNVAGSESWASSFSLNPTTLTLNTGQSGTFEATLNVNKGAAGSQTFFLELVSDGELVRQPVSVTVGESGGFLGITGAAISENAWLWGIGLLNLILVIVIIVVAVRIARRR